MEAENFLFHHSSQGEVIEEICEVFPHVGVAVLAEAFIVETVDLRDLTRFMISTENSHSVLVADLETDEKGHGLH
jgi:uncharacterized protein involved in propanediol utilization